MVIDFKRKPLPHAPLNILWEDIEVVDSFKYLGVHLNNKLDWSHNTNALYKKGQSRLHVLRRLRSFGVSRPLDTYPGLQFLHLLLASLHSDHFSLIQTVLQVFDGLLHVLLHALQVSTGVSLHLFLQTESFISAARLCLKRALKGVNRPLQVSLGLFYLVELKLGPENLSLLMF
uniref:Alkylated DNA repair protein AlkB homologue 8 N-terminal domain-containing protein n=1 Tax=Neogobius melanostomus TaxID=47308 RepID=A0A8C6TQQ6_9GOBI